MWSVPCLILCHADGPLVYILSEDGLILALQHHIAFLRQEELQGSVHSWFCTGSTLVGTFNTWG